MKRLTFTALLFSLFFFTSNAQPSDHGNFEHKNNVHIWAGGPGFIYNLSYERILVNLPPIKLSMEAGASFYPASSGNIGLWFPITANQTFFAKNHHLETGLGVVFTQDEPFKNQQKLEAAFGMFKIGYRYQRPKGRFIFRATFTPFLELERYGTESGASFTRELRSNFLNRTHAWGGVSFGYCF